MKLIHTKNLLSILILLLAIAVVAISIIPSHGVQKRKSLESKRVSYQGVSFAFDPSLAPEVTTATITASVEGKPSDIWPEHLGFSLVGFPRPRSLPENYPHIRVFSISKFRDALATATKEYAKSLAQPENVEDWALYLDTEVNALRSLVSSKPRRDNLIPFLSQQRGGPEGRGAGMPFLPLWEACQAFVARPRYVRFKNGEGVLFLTQMDVGETSQVTNQGLEYAFQGMTNDGQFYVYAEFSVAAPFLPMGNEPEVQQWNEKNYLLSHKSPAYQKYVRQILSKLEALPSNKFRPNLRLLEQLVETLEVKTQ